MVVHSSDQNDVTNSNTCRVYGGVGTCTNCIFGNEGLSSAVTSSSTALYFDGKVCSTDASFSTSDSVLLYSAKLTTYIHDPNVQIFLSPQMLPVSFQCKYKQSIDGLPISMGSMILDKPEKDGATKVNNADISSLTITPSVTVQQSDGSFADVSGDVILGSKVKVTFKSSANTQSIHIGNCIAGDKATSPVNKISLVANDCFQSDTTGPLSFIKPTNGGSTCGDVCQTELIMNQFAFVDPSSADAENPDLVFHMTCSIELGEAACTPDGRRRRQADKDYQMIEVSYSVNGTHFHIDEGVVHVLETFKLKLWL